ncbi:MAG: glutathione peroxidase [Clostridia bacterium]|nr:glutathione peroxidase [Anaerotignum sp.]NCC15588.1 glutathione peroxidase [Clostridia bacterium]
MNIYDFKVKARDGSDVALGEYKGKVLLVVNTATGCGFTPQYSDLQKIYEADHKNGLEILDFPCNQFADQAPGDDEEIHTFCTGRFGITFPQFSKIDVNGETAIPLYKWLTENTTFEGFDKLHPIGMVLNEMLKKQDPEFQKSSSIKWNFTKFLISPEGEIVHRFEPTASMKKVKEKIEEML